MEQAAIIPANARVPAPRGAQPACPRCGYDLSGVVATWRESCPLEGVCSECGSSVAWSEVVTGVELGPRWSIEHGRRRRVRRCWGTLLRTPVPRGMWRELDPSEPVRARRLVAYALGTLALLHALMVVGVAADLYRIYGWVPWGWYGGSLRGLAWPYAHSVEMPIAAGGTIAGPSVGVYMMTALLPTALVPLAVLALGVPVRRWRVRPGLVLRGACYTAPMGMLGGLAIAAAFNLALLLAVQGTPPMMMPDRPPLASSIVLGVMLSYPVWLGAWWRSLLRDHARIHRAGWAAVAATVASVLGTISLGVAWEVLAGPA